MFATGIFEDDQRNARVAGLARFARQALGDLWLEYPEATGHRNLQQLLGRCPSASRLTAPIM